MNILITGATGFIGHYISSQLASHTLFTPSSKELDLTNLNSVSKWFNDNCVDSVIHCALSGREVLSSIDPTYLSDGLLMFRNLWLHRKQYAQLINLGTAYEFDLNNNNTEVNEDDIINHLPTSSYGYSKNIIARIIRETDNFYNLRLFGVCSENESPLRFFKRVINQDRLIIGNDQYIDYIYLPDIMPMINCTLDGNAQHYDINMSYAHKYQLSELAYYLCEQFNIPKNKIEILGCNGYNLTGNSSRLASYNFDHIGIEQGLRNYK